MGLGILLRLLASLQILPRLVSPAAPLPAPTVIADPQHPVYFPGEHLTLRCSALLGETVRFYQFFHQRGKQVSTVSSKPVGGPWLVMTTEMGKAGAYSCVYRAVRDGRHLYSAHSQPVRVLVMDHPSQPALSVDPPSGVVSEGLPLLITCTSSGDAGEQRFHFYKDGDEIVPRDMGSEISTTEPGTGSRNVSVLSIPRAGPNSTGEFTCGYEKNVCGRWILSPSSRALNVTVNVIDRVSYNIHVIQLLGIGVILLLAGALTAVIYCCRKKIRAPFSSGSVSGEKLQECTKGSKGRECNRDLDLGRDNKGPKPTGAGAEQKEQGSEVTYALIAFSALEAHTTQSKSKAQPAEDEHVLYSEVVTKRIQKADK